MNYDTFKIDLYAASVIMEQYDESPKAFMKTFGCQQNVNDGERIRGVLASIGYEIVDEEKYADLIIYNTCAIREHAETKVFGNIGELKHLKKENPNLIIGVCGCMVQQKEIVEKFRKSYSFVDIIFGPNSIDEIPKIICEKIKSNNRILMEPSNRTDIVENIPLKRDSKTEAWVPIMYGCDNYCTFCIVPHVRGRERSRKLSDILLEIEDLVSKGYKSITLLGQNVNSYGKGLEEKIDFTDLLHEITKIEGEYIIKFMTSHPKDMNYKLLDEIACNPKIDRHIHLPLQSGSNRMLKLMNRRYTKEKYLDLVEYAKAHIKDVTFSSDIIVGFPGETEEEFEETLNIIKKVKYKQLYTFIYSKRTGTPAAKMPDPTSKEEKANRIKRIKMLQENYS